LQRFLPDLFFPSDSPPRDHEDDWSDGWDAIGCERKGRKLISGSNRRKGQRYKILAKKDVGKPVNSERLNLQCDTVLRSEYLLEEHGRSNEIQRQTFSQAEMEVEDPPICVICDDGGDLL
jgi:hypothetical protein